MSRTITVVHVTAPYVADVVTVSDDLESLQKLVGGMIEPVRVTPKHWVVCNDSGRINGMPFVGTVNGIEFFGPIFLTRFDAEGECVGLDERAAAKLAKELTSSTPPDWWKS